MKFNKIIVTKISTHSAHTERTPFKLNYVTVESHVEYNYYVITGKDNEDKYFYIFGASFIPYTWNDIFKYLYLRIITFLGVKHYVR